LETDIFDFNKKTKKINFYTKILKTRIKFKKFSLKRFKRKWYLNRKEEILKEKETKF
jgi:hypothetical protein